VKADGQEQPARADPGEAEDQRHDKEIRALVLR
jgi:hypothetical protein